MSFKAHMLIAASFLTLTACSKFDQIDKRTDNMDKNTEAMRTKTESMDSNTASMKNTTEKMAETTLELAKLTAQMNETTAHMYPQIRTKDTEEMRSLKYAAVLSDENGLSQKIAAAAVFYQSFEFQFWNNNNTFDSQKAREELFLDAANEFFRLLPDLYEQVDFSEISPTKKDSKENNAEMAFLALSVAMHMNNHHQEDIYEATNHSFELTSFYDLMKQSLLKDYNHEPLKAYEAIFVSGKNREISIALIQARVNMLLGLSLDYMVDTREIDSVGLGRKLSALVAKMSDGEYGAIRLTSLFEKANGATRAEILKRLDAAMKARAFLKSIKQNFTVDSTLKNVLNHIVLSPSRVKGVEAIKDYTEYKKDLKAVRAF